jgi:hypothetical protein
LDARVDDGSRGWESGRLTVRGISVEKQLHEEIPGATIADVSIVDQFYVDRTDPPPGAEPYGVYLDCFGRTDDEGWKYKGFDDKLYKPGKQLGWTHLLVSTSNLDALRCRLWEDLVAGPSTPTAEPTDVLIVPTVARGRWVVNKGKCLTKSEDGVLKAMQELFPDGRWTEQATTRDKKIAAHMKSRQCQTGFSTTNIKRALGKIRFIGPK